MRNKYREGRTDINRDPSTRRGGKTTVEILVQGGEDRQQQIS